MIRPGLTAYLVVLLAAALVAPACRSGDLPDDWVTVERDDLVLGVEVTGALQATDSDALGPPPVPRMWDFKITYMAPEGQEVARGQRVLAFDDSELVRELREKENERDAAAQEIETKRLTARMERRDEELELAEARAALRKAELKAAGPDSVTAAIEQRRAELDLELAQKRVAHLEQRARHTRRRDRAEIAILRDRHARAEQRVREIEAYLDRMVVEAPRTGTVIYTTDWRGDKKKVGDSAWRASKVLEIASLEHMSADGAVDEMDASKVAVGQPVTLRLDAHPDEELAGRVARIAESVQRRSPDTPLKVVKLAIELDRTEPRMMRPGMRFRGTVETGRRDDVLVIPVDAVFASEDGPVVYRRRGSGYQAVGVELGPRNRTHVEIVSGLRAGDRVSRTDLSQVAQVAHVAQVGMSMAGRRGDP